MENSNSSIKTSHYHLEYKISLSIFNKFGINLDPINDFNHVVVKNSSLDDVNFDSPEEFLSSILSSDILVSSAKFKILININSIGAM